MRLSFQILGFLCLFKCFLGEEEFTFGGGTDEETESTPPNINFNQGNNETLVKSEMQFLHVMCNVPDSPPDAFDVRWLNSKGGVVASNKFLYFKSLLQSHEGIYNCSIENKTNPSQKFHKSLNLKISVPSILIKILPDESLKINGKIRRQCSDLGLLPQTVVDDFTYTWLDKDNKTIGSSNILEIPVADSSVAGRYICQLKSRETSKIYEAVTIVDLNLVTDFKIRIIQTPSEMQYDKKLSLRCDVVPTYHNVKYNWKKNGEFFSSDQELTFENFNSTNFGTYRCEASVMLKTGQLDLAEESIQQLKLFRQSKIELMEKPYIQLFVHSGDKKELHCEIETDKNLLGKDVIWTKDGLLFNEKNVGNVDRLDRKFVSMLIMSNINKDNKGTYECKVLTTFKGIDLEVITDQGIIETSPAFLKVFEGQLVEFHCLAENMLNIKNVNLSWTFSSKDGSVKYPIADSRWEITNTALAEQTSFIDLTGARVHDSGYYTCTAPNGATSRSELIVLPNKEVSHVTITPGEVRVRSGQSFDFDCYAKNAEGRAFGEPYFLIGGEKRVAKDNRFKETNLGNAHIRLTAPHGLSLSDTNSNVTCVSGLEKVSSKIYVKDVCPPGFRYCQNGQCLENGKFCDNKHDCKDGSDENPIICRECDPISRKCENHNGAIPKKNYFLVHWICDGEDDCGNGYDEINCGEFSLDNCGGKYFNCSEGNPIPRGFVCDEVQDCPNGEDEKDCTHPQVIKSSDSKISATRSQQVVMTCEARGKPLPVIAWRFNWGCINNSSRFSVSFSTSTCNTVSSTLTIRDFQPGDDGIYNCEAISSRQRMFSNDFQVTLQND